MSFLNRLKSRLHRGLAIPLGSVQLQVSAMRNPSQDKPDNQLGGFFSRQARHLQTRYSYLNEIAVPITSRSGQETLDCFNTILGAIEPRAKEVVIRNALLVLQQTTNDQALHKAIELEIARSNLRSGIPDRAKLLADDEILATELEDQTSKSEAAYGGPFLSEDWSSSSRGNALVHFFAHHAERLEGKNILHFSPEPEFRHWLEQHSKRIGFTYVTGNLTGDDVDIHLDLTDTDIAGAYDLVFCHRVLEHVLDDAGAIRSLGRMLKPGGCLSASVPQSMHRPTNEWVVPDLTHHEHVRHYGYDFQDRLSVAGLDVQLETWLLQRPVEELRGAGAYPMRFYSAYKPNGS